MSEERRQRIKAERLMSEVERLRRLVDEAFHHLPPGKAERSRQALTEARWGCAWTEPGA